MTVACNPDAPVGVFDSGVGGLTVARAIIDQLPAENMIYVGDTANGPYGPLPLAAPFVWRPRPDQGRGSGNARPLNIG